MESMSVGKGGKKGYAFLRTGVRQFLSLSKKEEKRDLNRGREGV